ncbi:hypothetical protein DVR12_15590 [Chitinophaga silvatica]|uniref:Uncharacterized protein n=1 Tax=Chitinophaga silvatica TaxID=2282649 RepID=A0A3E1Y843_9BACT|nr:hypothetical protein DVR12_15590 [Chitinophaga silvatica]
MKQAFTSKSNYRHLIQTGFIKVKLAYASVKSIPPEWKLMYALIIIMGLRLVAIAVYVIKQL